MKLNLGCGNDIKPGYVNVDFRKTHPDVRVVDLSVLPWPFEDGSADEILMLDFLEHFPYAQTKQILLECHRCLKPDGELVVQVPDGRHLMSALCQRDSYLCNRCGFEMLGSTRDRIRVDRCEQCGQSADDISEAAMRRLYGGQDYPGNFHHTCFTDTSLEINLSDCGFDLVQWEEKPHQYKNWNMKARFRKGDPW